MRQGLSCAALLAALIAGAALVAHAQPTTGGGSATPQAPGTAQTTPGNTPGPTTLTPPRDQHSGSSEAGKRGPEATGSNDPLADEVRRIREQSNESSGKLTPGAAPPGR